jgi:hypothetical protein
MVAAYFYALLNIARERFAESDQGQDDQASLGAPWAQESPPAASNDPHLENLGFLR